MILCCFIRDISYVISVGCDKSSPIALSHFTKICEFIRTICTQIHIRMCNITPLRMCVRGLFYT